MWVSVESGASLHSNISVEKESIVIGPSDTSVTHEWHSSTWSCGGDSKVSDLSDTSVTHEWHSSTWSWGGDSKVSET